MKFREPNTEKPKTEHWLVFRDKETGRELCAYTVRGSFPGEAKATAELLAYENDLNPDQISITIEEERMKYFVLLNTRGIQEIVFEGTKEECSRYEDSLRKEIVKSDPDKVEMDCFVLSAWEIEKMNEAKTRWESLTDEQKQGYVYVDGRKYIRAIHEANKED